MVCWHSCGGSGAGVWGVGVHSDRRAEVLGSALHGTRSAAGAWGTGAPALVVAPMSEMWACAHHPWSQGLSDSGPKAG